MICIIHNAVKPTCKQIKKDKILKINPWLSDNKWNEHRSKKPHNKWRYD